MFIVNKRKVGQGMPPYIIAELSANHGGKIVNAKRLISAAKEAGADAVKIQSYTPETMTFDLRKPGFVIEQGLWAGKTLYDLYSEAHTPYEWHEELFNFASAQQITLFSTPFDETAIDFLEDLDTPAYKIASFELVDLPLIKYAASKKKPLFLSTGMSSVDEIAAAVEVCRQVGNQNILLFHCISSYPARLSDSALSNISYLAQHFDVEVGLSDHTESNVAATVATALGACAIEKHFKIDPRDEGPDSSFSILPEQFKQLCIDCREVFEALQGAPWQRADSEFQNKIFRRSVYFSTDLKKGHRVTPSDMRKIRPGYGLEPTYFDDVIGRILACDVERGDPVSFSKFVDSECSPKTSH